MRLMEFSTSEKELMLTGIPVRDIPDNNFDLTTFVVELLAREIVLSREKLHHCISNTRCNKNASKTLRKDSKGNNLPPSDPIFVECRQNADRNEILVNSQGLTTGRLNRVTPRRHQDLAKRYADTAYQHHRANGRVRTRVAAVIDVDLGYRLQVQVKNRETSKWDNLRGQGEQAPHHNMPQKLQDRVYAIGDTECLAVNMSNMLQSARASSRPTVPQPQHRTELEQQGLAYGPQPITAEDIRQIRNNFGRPCVSTPQSSAGDSREYKTPNSSEGHMRDARGGHRPLSPHFQAGEENMQI